MDTTSKKNNITDPKLQYKKHIGIFEQSPISIELYDSDGKLQNVNQACLDLFGLKNAKAVIGFNLFDNPHLTEQIIIDIRAGKAIKYELAYDFELVKNKKLYETTKSGISFLECYINPTTNKNRKITGYIVHITEITERKQAESALRKSEEKFRRIVESSTTAMHFYYLYPDGRLILTGVNPMADGIMGLSHNKLIGKTIEEAFPNLKETEIPTILKRIAKGKSPHYEFEFEHKEGSTVIFFQVRTFQTELNSITIQFIDISERKKAAILLEQQAKKLKELNETKDKFFSIIAHDLKNPFGAIIGFSDLMLDKFDELDDQTLLKGLKTIQSASDHAYKLLENLLVWSQNQTGRKQFSPENLNLKDRVAASIKMVESSATRKGIKIIVCIKKSINVFADKDMLDSILRNLISNAIKYSHQGGKVKITATESDHEIQISVADNGVGITPENQSAIFRIDKRTNTVGTDNELGTGLGLILCKDFITKHLGKILVDSIPGQGCSVTITLPVKKEYL